MAISVSQIINQPTYTSEELQLLNTSIIEASFNPSINYIEYIITDEFNSFQLVDNQYSRYSFPTDGTVTSNFISSINFDPSFDIKSKNLNVGNYITHYNFYQNEANTSPTLNNFFIKEISSDRTEITVGFTSLFTSLESVVTSLKADNSDYFKEFYLNFGNGNVLLSNNVKTNPDDTSLIFNLYQPLPDNIQNNASFWIVTKIADTLSFRIDITPEPYIPTVVSNNIKGPNFNLPIKDQTNNTTGYLDYSTLLQAQSVSSSNQIKSLLAEKGIDINIDYTDFKNFIHFSSAYQRIVNFYYKVKQIEDLNNKINALSSVTNSSSSISTYQSQITSIIENFDDYDYYLYYSSGSWAYPKISSELPYELYPTSSSEVIAWLGSGDDLTGILGSASLYDENNQNNLYYAIPEYIRDDERNAPYYLFIEMIGQHYDGIWTYYKDVTNLHIADNRLDHGISKDLVAEALKSFGVKIYQNNFTTQDLYASFLGYTSNNPEITSSLPVSPNSFQEYISNYITASYDASVMPLDDYNKEIYKRLYHNLPYLAKTKGTIPGLRALINCFGVPDTVLRISEFGGRDKDTSTYDYFDQQYDYAAIASPTAKIYTPWILNAAWSASINEFKASSVQFRFKTSDFDTGSNYQLWNISPSISTGPSASLVLKYTGSGLISSSYSGSTVDSYNQYAHLTFYPKVNDLTNTASIYLPFFDHGWWSVMINKHQDTYTLYAGNKLYYNGYDGNQIGHFASSSVTLANTFWTQSGISIFLSSSTSIGGTTYNIFTGSLQEIRYWIKTVNEDSFKDYVMNPQSIDYSGETLYDDYLVFRLPLGGDLYTGSASVHPRVTGSWVATGSFIASNTATLTNVNFIPNVESRFLNSPIIGLKGRVTDKIQIVDSIYPTGSVLSQYRSLEQSYPSLGSESPDVNLLEVAFSPQNEINDDIIDSLGYFNIGEYIGDPRQVSSSATTYPDLNRLSNNFFQKYFDSYNLFDYVRLIKYFDNSLFKMIQDFVPARTSLTSGVVIKQHILERNKYPQPQVSWEDVTYSGSIDIASTDGGTGGTFNSYNFTGSTIPPTFINNTQSWGEEVKTPVGLLTVSHSTQDEFYNGELPNSIIIVSNGELNEVNPFKYPNDTTINYTSFLYKNSVRYPNSLTQNITSREVFLSPNTAPDPGEMYLWYDDSVINLGAPPSLTGYYESFYNWNEGNFKYSVEKIKYIKINSIDLNGLDITNTLSQIQSLTLTLPDKTFTYPIASIQNYGSYFLYGVGPYYPLPTGNGELAGNPNTSSLCEIPDFSFDANLSAFTSISPGVIYYLTGSSWTVNNDSLGAFNNTAGNRSYTYPITPNVPITFIFTASFLEGSPGQIAPFAYLINKTTSEFQASFSTTGLTDTTSKLSGSIILTGSNSIIENDSFIVAIGAQGSGLTTGTWTFVGFNWYFTQSIAPLNSSQSIAIFDPYLPQGVASFEYNDYNPLLDNAESPQESNFFMDVDYSQNPLIPINQSLILNQIADKAKVQDSNYASFSWKNIRYNGSRNNSVKFN